MTIIGNHLRLIRKSKNLSLNDIYKLTGITNSRLSKIETGIISDPPAKDLLSLSKVYNINILDLYLKANYLDEIPLQNFTKLKNIDKLSNDELQHIQSYIDFIITNRKD